MRFSLITLRYVEHNDLREEKAEEVMTAVNGQDSATSRKRVKGLHVTVEDKHFLPCILHDLIAEIPDEPSHGDSLAMTIFCRD